MYKKIVKVVDLKIMEYEKCLEIQRDLRDKCIDGKIDDTLLLVEHPAVITMGRRGKEENILVTKDFLQENDISIHWIERGGDITYHGLGQLVVYPIFNLNNFEKDIHKFVEGLESSIIKVLKAEFNIDAHTESGKHTGVYVAKNKIAAIGLAVRKWVTMHGFALNINTDLSHFSWITPCGLTDRGVTSIRKELGEKVDFDLVKNKIISELSRTYDKNFVLEDLERVNK